MLEESSLSNMDLKKIFYDSRMMLGINLIKRISSVLNKSKDTIYRTTDENITLHGAEAWTIKNTTYKWTVTGIDTLFKKPDDEIGDKNNKK